MDCIIAAKGLSRRLPRKNLRLLRGVPLLGYAVESASLAGVFGNVWVSTEDAEVARVARDYGAGVIDRPAELAEDSIRVREVVDHALEHINREHQSLGLPFHEVVGIVYPTAFLLEPDDIRNMWRYLQSSPHANGVMTVVAPSENPLAMMVRTEEGFLERFWPGKVRDQAISEPDWAEWIDGQTTTFGPWYQDAGYCYIYRVDAFRQHGFYPPRLLAWELPRSRVVDINTEADLQVAEALLEHWFRFKT